ncbi:MAG: hypothetical protein KatS3mg002_0394 [Candidatus Woesearchaeota archaeon]|nr:MAG: hypothetical protein KatS3mg002_0394 [Candidatus Woesearchaeota archaeon]
MSADNGIYITSFPTKDGKEWRVIEARAIENCFDDPRWPQEIIDLYRVMYYIDAERFETEKEARERAWQMYDEVMSREFPILEYGISRRLDVFWESWKRRDRM